MKYLCLFLFSLLGLSLAVVYKHKLRPINSVRERKITEGTWFDHLRTKNARKAIMLKSGAQPVKDYDDLSYVAEINLGSSGQTFQVILDTGSSNLWVPDETCSANACSSKMKFESSRSTTYQQNGRKWQIMYGTGSAEGFLGKDKFCFGSSGLCIDEQTFGQATYIADFFGHTPIDGICGMAFSSISVDHVTPPFINLIPHLDQPIFTVWMEHRGNTVGTGGQFTYGAFDTEHCEGSPDWVYLSSATYYQFDIDGASAGSYSANRRMSAISDTGTSLITGPSSVINNLASELGGSFDSRVGGYVVDCNAESGPDLVFTIGGKDYGIPMEDYVVNIQGICIIGISPGGGGFGGPEWILGDTFIRGFCNVYDPQNQRIGFAKAKV